MMFETPPVPTYAPRARGCRGAERCRVAGLLFHPIVVLEADHDPKAASPFGPSTYELIVERGIRHFCLAGIPSPVRQRSC